MHLTEAKFIGSYTTEVSCPQDGKPEYAFIGRSNVGKSSLINMLTNRRKLAKVSNTPGKTQTINYFMIDESWYLVDLPGYGYARISQTQRDAWQLMISDYFQSRPTLQCAFVLIDVRHDLQQIDLEFINWLGENKVPFAMVFTKADKLKKASKIQKHVDAINKSLLQYWHSLPQQFITSSETKMGKEEILSFIQEINNRED